MAKIRPNRKAGRRSRISIKWTLFQSFLLFSAILLILLWLFQIVFLDSFYRQIKTNTIVGMADTLSRNIDNEALATLVTRVAQEHDVCVLIISNRGQTIATADVQTGCIIHRMPPIELLRLFEKTRQAGGSYLEYFSRDAFRDDRYNADRFVGPVPRFDSGLKEAIIYARTVTLTNGTEAVILLNAILSLILALLLSRRIARPIIQINERARELAKGRYDVQFQSSGYKEIAELADTLSHAAVELNQVETLRRELIANVSHDLRTPLTMISGYAEVMRDLPGENSPENIQVVIDEARRLTSLVNDLLDLSRLQSGSPALTIRTYNLTDSIRKTLSRYNKLIEQDGFDIALEADRDVTIQADENRIDQVLHNLINNAVNYTGDDKRVTVRQHVENNQVRIEVCDSGDGIPPDQMPYIWNRYYKGSKMHRRPVVGTGLGLSIVKNILEQHQVPFGAANRPEGGCVFWFMFQTADQPPS
jgi:signal transduction histidine kinase